MKIIIAGAGGVGTGIARSLEAEGHDITLIDRDEQAVTRASNEMDVICVQGTASNPETLREAGADEADILIAVTDRDEVNLICALAGRRLGAGHIIARVRDPEYLSQMDFLREAFGISLVVNPEYECAREISRVLRFPAAVRVETFAEGGAEIVECRLGEDSPLDGMSLRDAARHSGAKVLVCVAERGEEVLIPKGDFILRRGDRLGLMGEAGELRRFISHAGGEKRRIRNVMIMGGSRTAVFLAQLLKEDGIAVTVFERDKARCEELCDLIPDARIINGDATKDEVLLEEGVRAADAFVALTGDDGDNIVTAMYAKRCGVPKTVVKVNMRHFSGMLDDGTETMVTPKDIVRDQITSYVRAIGNSAEWGNIETLHKLAGGRIEATEFRVGPGAACVGIPLKDLRMRGDVLFSAITSSGTTRIPDGSSIVREGDSVVIVAPAERVKDINDIMEGEK